MIARIVARLIAGHQARRFRKAARIMDTLDDWMLARKYPKWERKQAWRDIIRSPEARKALFKKLGSKEFSVRHIQAHGIY